MFRCSLSFSFSFFVGLLLLSCVLPFCVAVVVVLLLLVHVLKNNCQLKRPVIVIWSVLKNGRTTFVKRLVSDGQEG